MRYETLTIVLVAAVVGALGCSPGPRVPEPGPELDEVLAERPRVLWVAAHPDDESMASGLLARACIKYQSACHFLVFNRGRGGECCLPEGCAPDLGTVRGQEMSRAARDYHATLEHYDLYNAPLPVSSFPTVPELEQRWMSEGDPIGVVARAIRRFRPDLVVTFSPYRGYTGHPEHRAAARFALAGAQLAADPAAEHPKLAGSTPHRIRFVAQVLNKYWIMSLVGNANDPQPYTWTLDSDEICSLDRQGQERSCVEIGANATRVHQSQDNDMAALRSGAKFLGTAFVRRIDPWGAEAKRLVVDIGKVAPSPTVAER